MKIISEDQIRKEFPNNRDDGLDYLLNLSEELLEESKDIIKILQLYKNNVN